MREALLPAAALVGAKASSTLAIRSGQATVILEPSRLPISDWAGQLGVPASELNIRFTIETALDEVAFQDTAGRPLGGPDDQGTGRTLHRYRHVKR
ncbi:hypothetical protein [Paenibacillus sp. GCM10012303]|uniref:hypothetical protein n=1 Tax=Paenibacillus sp. GCM10012303 TaxID=3317340 RepID=UPI003617B18A